MNGSHGRAKGCARGAVRPECRQGVWRDDERGGRLVWDEPVIVHCYASERNARRRASMKALGDFCREMGRSTNQGEVGLVIDNVYHAIRPE